MTNTKKWRLSGWSRLFAILCWTFVILLSEYSTDSWLISISMTVLCILTFIFMLVIPDKLLLGDRLVKVKDLEEEK